MKYNVGDRIRIKSLDWYNKNKDNLSFHTYSIASCFANKIVTIKSYGRYPNTYYIDEYEGDFLWTDEMIEGLVEEEKKSNIIEEAKTYWDSIKDAWICPDGYIFKDENGNVIEAKKIVLEKKKKEYPKTYEECCKVFGIDVRDLDILDNMLDTSETVYSKNLDRLLNSFRKLLICRNAYWKIAGEEMGLGEPWKPNWENGNQKKYGIYNDMNIIKTGICYFGNDILVFPTEKIRDNFYENFRKLIEQCEELL